MVETKNTRAVQTFCINLYIIYYVFIHVYIYVYIIYYNIYIYIYIYICIHIYIYYIHVYVYTYLHASTLCDKVDVQQRQQVCLSDLVGG